MPDQTEGFLNQIVVMLPAFRAVEERLDRETGRRFSVFDLFRTDEPATNRLLDVLLNPKGAHGQSDVSCDCSLAGLCPNGVFRLPAVGRIQQLQINS